MNLPMPETPPVLLLIHRRVDTTARVLEAIRKARPSRLFVAADGPGPDRKGEGQECETCRRLVDEGVDWPCQVQKLYRQEHLGLRDAVSQAITWFFEQVEEGIILEDDTLPSADFFRYCAVLLERYREEEKVWVIGGTNSIGSELFRGDSYAFTYYNPIWGWASWRRAWRFYGHLPVDIEAAADPAPLEELLGSADHARYWSDLFRRTARGKINSWAYLWRLTLWRHGALSTMPSANLISNIGFDERGTHTLDAKDPRANRKREALAFPLVHPKVVEDNRRITALRLSNQRKGAESRDRAAKSFVPRAFFSRVAERFKKM